MAGYVRTYRDAMEHPVFQDDWLWRLFSWCLLKANWRPMRFRGINVEPGQFVTGRVRAAEELGVTQSKWYRGIEKLQSEDYGCIKVEANREWTIITVINWQTYQSGDDTERTANEQQMNSQRTASEQQTNTIKELQELQEHTFALSATAEGVSASKPQAKKRKPFAYSADFERFWSVYPRRIAKVSASKEFESAVTRVRDEHKCDRAQAVEYILHCAEEFAGIKRGTDEKYIVYPERWLKKGQYDDVAGGSAA